MCVSMTFISCEKCGHCNIDAGGTIVEGSTACGKPDYDNAKKACESGGLGGTPAGTWVDE
ncbi:MAG: hypothetical protein POELPBGB_01355 [Bacteroidia bacterium]|nr:hypothetical protein [Bacteroidia bacterium]